MNTITSRQNGHLVIIGGGEDRVDDKEILAKFVELSGGTSANIVVITAASTVPEKMWEIYDEAFGALGVERRAPLHIASRAEANDPGNVRRILDATGIFMTGGDQKRMLAMIGGTEIAGAGAADAGAVIDQHFSERHRLARLLSIVAQNPYLHGVGIDEDTALVIELDVGIEVIGNGSVTLVDGRHIISNVADARRRASLELIDVRLHMLPAGSRYRRPDSSASDVPVVPEPLHYIVDILTQKSAHHEDR